MSKTETLSVDVLRLDGDTQARIKISEETVSDYAELISSGNGEWALGPLDVFHDGSDYFVADGFHRTLAAIRTKRASVPCRVHKGTAKDAKLFGMTANDKHGLRMSQADKRACVEWLLENGPKMKQAEIAEKAGVSKRFVQKVVADRKPEKAHGALFESETLELSSETDEPATPTPDSEAAQEQAEPLDLDGDDPDFDVPDPPAPPEASVMLDSLGKPIPKHLRPASELAILLQSTGREVDKFRKTAKELAEQPGGEWLNLQTIDDEVRSLKNSFQGAQYHTVCPRCNSKGCQRCNQFGYLPEHRKNSL